MEEIHFYFSYKIKSDIISKEKIIMQIKLNEEENIIPIEENDEIKRDNFYIKTNTFKIKRESILNTVKLIIKINDNILSQIIKIPNELNQNIFLFDIYISNENFIPIDKIIQYTIFLDFLKKNNKTLYIKDLRKNFIEVFIESDEIKSKVLINLMCSTLKNKELSNFVKIISKIKSQNFFLIKKEAIEKYKDEIINKCKDNNFILEIKKIINENGFNLFICKLKCFLSYIYILFNQKKEFYELLKNIDQEHLLLFLQIISQYNIFHIFTFSELFEILENIKKKIEEIPTQIISIIFSLLNNFEDKLKLIFESTQQFTKFFNSELIEKIESNDNEIEKSIDIKDIIDFSKLEDKNIEKFLEYYDKYLNESFSSENITRYIFYFNTSEIFKKITQTTFKYSILKKSIEILENIDEDDEYEDLITQINIKIEKYITNLIERVDISSKDYFLEISNFLEEKQLKGIIENKIINFSQKFSSLSYSDFKLLDGNLKKIIFEIPDNYINMFIEKQIKENNDLLIINEIFVTFSKLYEQKINIQFIQIFAMKINKLLLIHDKNEEFNDMNFFILFKNILNSIKEKNKKEIMLKIFDKVDPIILLLVIFSYEEKDLLFKNLINYFKNIQKINKNNTISYLKFFFKKRNSNQLNQLNEKEIKIFRIILESFTEYISEDDFFQNYISDKEQLFIDLKNFQIINNENFNSINFIKKSIEFFNSLKDSLENRIILISQFFNFSLFKEEKILKQKLQFIYEEEKVLNIFNFIQEKINYLKEINSNILECETILKELFYKCNSLKFHSEIIFIKNILKNGNLQNLDLNETQIRNEAIKNFVKKIEPIKAISSSLVFRKIYTKKLNEKGKFPISIDENETLLNQCREEFISILNTFLINNDFPIDKIEFYFLNVDIPKEIKILLKYSNSDFTESNIQSILNKIYFIVERNKNLSNIEKLIEFLSFFKININELEKNLKELKNEITNLRTINNLEIIQEKCSLTYLSNKGDFNLFIQDLISINNLLRIIKEYSIDTIKEYFNLNINENIKVQNIEKFIVLSITLKEIFEKEFQNDKEFIQYIKKNLFDDKENFQKIKLSLILNEEASIFENLGKQIIDKKKTNKNNIISLIKNSSFILELKKKNEIENYQDLHSILINDINLNENDLIRLWESTFLILSNNEENNISNVFSSFILPPDNLNDYKDFNLIIKQILKEKRLLAKSIRKGCFNEDKIYNRIINGKLQIKENDIFLDYEEFMTKLNERIEKMENDIKNAYEKYYNLTFFYGPQFSKIESLIESKNFKEIELYMRYMTNGYYFEKYEEAIPKQNYQSLFEKINCFINNLFQLNQVNLEEIFRDILVKDKHYNFESGFYLKTYKSHFQREIIILNYYLTGNFPFAAGVLFCKNSTTLEEVIAFFYRFIKCQFKIVFFISNFLDLKNYIKSEIINLFKIKENEKLNAILIFLEKPEKEKEFKYYFSQNKFYNGENLNFFEEKESKLISKIRDFCDVEIIDSNCCGLGKTNTLYYNSKTKSIKLITFPFGYTNLIHKIIDDLKLINFDEKIIILHLNIYDTKYIDVLEEFLFYLVFTSFLIDEGEIFFIQKKVKIIIEIPYGFYHFENKCKIFNLIKLRKISSPQINLGSEEYSELKKKLNVIDSYQDLYEENLINEYSIKESNLRNSKSKNKKTDLLKNKEDLNYYFNKIKEITGLNEMNYYQFFAFINILYSQLNHLTESIYLSPKTLKNNYKKSVLETRKILYENLVKFSKTCASPSFSDYSSPSFFNYKINLDDYSEEEENQKISDYYYKGKKISFNDLPGGLVLFNHDNESISIITNSKKIDKNTKSKLKELWNSQNIKRIQDLVYYNELDQNGFIEQIKIYFNINKDLNLRYKDYIFTIDNYIKLILIDVKSQAKMPILLMGETGCGKTYLIQIICSIKKIKLRKLNIHGGIKEEDVLNFMNNYVLNEDEKKEIWVFFDEINTSEIIGLISEIMCNRTMKGKKLNDNLQFIAACNPYRIKKNLSSMYSYGLKIKNGNKNLDYNVHPLPISLLNFTFDFGSIKNEDEIKYIKEMISNNGLNNYYLDNISTLISISQIFFRKEIDPNSVSLRDIKRFCDLYNWFIYYFTEIIENEKKEEIEYKAIFLSLYINYIIRIPIKQLRLDYYKKIENLNNHNIKEIIRKEKNNLCERMTIPKGIALNEALKENLFALFTCIMSKIPIFIIGKPGCSKSLGMEIIYDSLKGLASKDKLFKKLPVLIYINFQGSLNTSSNDVQEAFNKIKELTENIDNKNLIPVLFFDELGLAENSKNNPLKILHAELDNYGNFYDDDENEKIQKFSFVGISNYFLDYSKQNRGITLFRDDLDKDDLMETAKKIFSSFNNVYKENLFSVLVDVYYEYKKNLRDNYRDFHSTRDFYFLIKQISKKISTNPLMNEKEIYISCFYYLQNNFSGLNSNIIKNYVPITLIFKDKINFFENIEYNLEKALIDNINDQDSRYLLLITNSSTSDFLIEYILKKINKVYTLLIGSQFTNDIFQKNYSMKILNKIIVNVEYGNFLIFKNLDTIYFSLYDLFNLHFHYLKEIEKKYVRLSLGMINIPRLFVHDRFKCAILIDENDVYNKDPPFLNRFEKHIISFKILLNEEEINICEYIYNMFQKLTYNKNNLYEDIDLKNQKVNLGKEEIFGLYYKVKQEFNKNEDDNNNISNSDKIKEEIIKILSKNLSQDILIHSKFCELTKNELENIYQYYNLFETNNLEQFLKKIQFRLNIIYTFSSEFINIKNNLGQISSKNILFNQQTIEEAIISSFQSQLEIEDFLNEFYSGNKNLLLFKFNVSQSHHLNHIISLIENIEKNNNINPQNKIIILIICLKRNFFLDSINNNKNKEQNFIKEKDFVSNLTGYNQIFIDNLFGKNRTYHFIDILNSNETLLKCLDLNNNLENLIKHAYNSLILPEEYNNIKFEKESLIYNKIQELTEKYTLNLDNPIKLYFEEKSINLKTIDLYEHYVNYIKIILQKYITCILIIFFKYDLIAFSNYYSKEDFSKIIDSLIIKEEISTDNIQIYGLSNEIEKEITYNIPFISIYFQNLNKNIEYEYKIKFMKNEKRFLKQSKENNLEKNNYLDKKNKYLKNLIDESNIMINNNLKFIIFKKDIKLDKLKSDFLKFFIIKNKTMEEVLPIISYIFDLVCDSYKSSFNQIKESNLNLIIYSCLWFETYKKLFIFRFIENILILKPFFNDNFNINTIIENIKELIKSKTIKFVKSDNNPEMKKLCTETIFLLNESFLHIINIFFKKNIKAKDKNDLSSLNCIYSNSCYIQNNFFLYGEEIWKIEITKLIYENIIDSKMAQEIIKNEILQDEKNSINDEELIVLLNKEIEKIKSIEFNKNSNYNNSNFIIKLLISKYKLFKSIKIRKHIFKIILNDEEILLYSKQIFNLIFTNFLHLNPFQIEDEDEIENIEILNVKNELIDFIESMNKSKNSEIIYNLIVMDIFSKFILQEFFNSNNFHFIIFKKFVDDIIQNEDSFEENKKLRYLFKIEYIKIYLFYSFCDPYKSKEMEENNLIEYLNQNEKNLTKEIKVYLIKCIKFNLNDLFSNLENYNGPIKWVKSFIETEKSPLLYIPMKMIYINFEQKYNKIKENYYKIFYLKKKIDDEFLKDKEDCYCFTHFFYNEKASFILFKNNNKNENLIRGENIEVELKLLSPNSKILIQCICSYNNFINLQEEEISLFILCFNVWSYFSEFYQNVFNQDTLSKIIQYKINVNEQEMGNLIFAFFVLAFKYVNSFIINIMMNKDEIRSKFNKLNSKISSYYNLNNAYCFIYYLLSEKINIQENNDPIEFLEIFVHISLNNLNFKKDKIYDLYFSKFAQNSQLSFNNPKFTINELFYHNDPKDYIFLFKYYVKPENIVSSIKPKDESLFKIYYDDNNQQIFKKIHIFFEKINPFIKLLHKQYFKKITRLKASNLTLKNEMKKNIKLKNKFSSFEEGLKELFNFNEIKTEIPLINFLFHNNSENNKFKLFEKCNQLIEEFNKISLKYPKLFNKIIPINVNKNKFDLTDIKVDDIIPEKESNIQITYQYYNNSYRKITYIGNKEELNFSCFSNINFDYKEINELFTQEYKKYLWELPKAILFEFYFEFENGLNELLNNFYQIFTIENLSQDEIKKIRHYLKDKDNIFQILSLLQNIFLIWKKNNKNKFELKLIDELNQIVNEEEINTIIFNKKNIILSFLNNLDLKTHKILSLYEFIEENYFNDLTLEIPNQYKKEINEFEEKIFITFFKKNEKKKKNFIQILRKFILRYLIGNNSNHENINLILSLKDINDDEKEIENLNLLKEIETLLTNKQINLSVEKSISLYNSLNKQDKITKETNQTKKNKKKIYDNYEQPF